MPATIRLLATDLDGTLIGGASDLPRFTEFHDRIEELRSRYNLVWVACTGRTWDSFNAFFSPMRRFGIVPDYVIVRHAYIFRRVPWGFSPHVRWNIITLYRMWREVLRSGETLRRWHEEVTGAALGVRTVRRSRSRLSIRFDTEESARVAADILRKQAAHHQHLRVISQLREVDVRFVPATKGHAVSELARHLKVAREEILAVGNGLNDISMLNGTVAALTGCPSNSDQDVVAVVHDAGGHVAQGKSLSGVIEILDAYATDNIHSALPEAWNPPQKTEFSKMGSPSKQRSFAGASPWLFLFIVYIGLLAFAIFDIIPFSGIIRKPVDLLIQLIIRLTNLLS